MNQGQLLSIFMLHFDELENNRVHATECLPCRTGVPCKKGKQILRAFQLRHEEVKNLMELFRSNNGTPPRDGIDQIKPSAGDSRS